MNIAIVNQTDLIGGAARAAYRIHSALNKYGLNSKMYVDRAISDDPSVIGPVNTYKKACGFTRPHLDRMLVEALMNTSNTSLHSLGLIPSEWPKKLNVKNIDVVNLHWVAGGMMSIGDISKIRKPIVWTLHDMWPFCGTEHYEDLGRYRSGYTMENRSELDSGLDIDRWAWNRKVKLWGNHISIVCPSNWLAKCARESILFGKNKITVIPNTIDLEVWRPIEMNIAREICGLPLNRKLILFGAVGGDKDLRKGFDLLIETVKNLESKRSDFEIIVFGSGKPKIPLPVKSKVRYYGALKDDISLCLLYNSVDVFAVPSRMDNLPNTGLEAHACGVPVAAFNIGGLSDIVLHKKTGFLANPFDAKNLAQGINWIINQDNNLLRLNSRMRAIDEWSSETISEKYYNIYKDCINEF